MSAGAWGTAVWPAVPFVLAMVIVASAALLALAAPAQAYPQYVHGGIAAADCSACHVDTDVSDDDCTQCHAGFTSEIGHTCWDCHAPGADTSSLSSPSSACSQDCHLWDESAKVYQTAYTHGTSPHLGASGYGKSCLDCHETSAGPLDPNGSPHHDGVTVPPPSCADCHNGVDASKAVSHDGTTCEQCHDGMNIPPRPATCTQCHAASTFGSADCARCHAKQIHTATPAVGKCQSCHTGYQKHAGVLACTKCHTNAKSFHHQTQKPKVKSCTSCHAMKHAGRTISASKCAGCHKGSNPAAKPRAQHSSKITKKHNCSLCHSKPLHAKSFGASITCRTCHTGKFHVIMPRPGNSVCTKCHGSAWRHANGFRCTTCHLNLVHVAAPRLSTPRL